MQIGICKVPVNPFGGKPQGPNPRQKLLPPQQTPRQSLSCVHHHIIFKDPCRGFSQLQYLQGSREAAAAVPSPFPATTYTEVFGSHAMPLWTLFTLDMLVAALLKAVRPFIWDSSSPGIRIPSKQAARRQVVSQIRALRDSSLDIKRSSTGIGFAGSSVC